jgi:hypothetical protein
LPVQAYAMLYSCAFVKGIVTKVLNKADAVYLQFIYFGAELYQLGFFATYDGA